MADEPNDLDLLMSLDPLEYSDMDIDIIIAYQRNARAAREAGVKPTRKPKSTTSGPTAAELMKSLGLKKAQPKTVVGDKGSIRRI